MAPEAQPSIILLHGIMRTKLSMRHLEKLLTKQGYRVLNIGYPSFRKSIADIIDHLHPVLDNFIKTAPGPVHFGGYSMGGLVIRAYLHKYRPTSLGRVIMLGTPNQGSEVADFLQNYWLYRKIYGPAGQQLITNQAGFNHLFGPVDYPLGIIAGNRSLDVIGSRIIGQPNDGKVSVFSTKIDGMTDHVIIPVDHTFLPRNKSALAYSLKFLKDGKF